MPKLTKASARRGGSPSTGRAAGRGLWAVVIVRPLPWSAFGTNPFAAATRGHHLIWVITGWPGEAGALGWNGRISAWSGPTMP